MYQCQFCGLEIPENARFCGRCGRVLSNPEEWSKSSHYDLDAATTISTPANFLPSWNTNEAQDNQALSFSSMPTLSSITEKEEEEEEKRRRAALFALGAPLAAGAIADGQPFAANVPMVQGTPQLSGVPFVQGPPTPPLPAGSMEQGFYGSMTQQVPPVYHAGTVPHAPAGSIPMHAPHPSSTSHVPHHLHPHPHPPRGCAPTWLIVAIIIPLIIIASIIGIGLAILTPSLSLNGGTSVVQGGTLTLNGSHFFPGSSVTLTLDDTQPLYFTSQEPAVQTSSTRNFVDVSGMNIGQVNLAYSSSNTVPVAGDGTFTVSINVSQSWSVGQHSIRASESLTHRSAQLAFTIYLPGTTPTPSPTVTASPSLTVTPSPTVTVSPSVTASTSGLNCVNPSSLAFGPVSEGYTLPLSTKVTLCTTGTGTISWTASWNANQAPWLQLDHTSGQILAPGQAQINVTAQVGGQKPGNYTAIVTFTSQPGNTPQTLGITFTVQAGCVKATPVTLSFTGIAGVSDPPTQTVAMTNCSALGTWTATTQTDNKSNWLTVSPTGNTLSGGASTTVTVTASNLGAKLGVGTYQGKIIFAIGSGSFIVSVTLTVQPGPTLSVYPGSIYANQQCSSNQGSWICYVTLTNDSNSLSLSWTATSSGVPGITFKPAGDTLMPAQQERVQITVPQNNCQIPTTLTFTGPSNTVNVSWTCTLIGQ